MAPGNKDEARKSGNFARTREDEARRVNPIILVILVGVVASLGTVVSILYSCHAETWADGLTILANAFLFFGACFMTGALTGLVFGIPRALQTEHRGGGQYGANTNLEQISDWLTKMLVGVGLIQITKIKDAVKGIAKFMGPALGDTQGSESFAVSGLVVFLVSGFLLGYVWARRYLPRLFSEADEGFAEVKSKVQQWDADETAVTTVDRQLDRSIEAPQVDQKELDAVVSEASGTARSRIFARAQRARAQNWRDEKKKPIMEKTIAVFKALIAADRDKRYHRNHAELGYALKDQCKPDYDEAVRELTIAIEMRKKWRDAGWLVYEFNRAFARIKLEEEQINGAQSSSHKKEEILDDIKEAARSEVFKKTMLAEPVFTRWMDLNGVSRDSL